MNIDRAEIPCPYNYWDALRNLGRRYGDEGLTLRVRVCLDLPVDEPEQYPLSRQETEAMSAVLSMQEVRRTVAVAFARNVNSIFAGSANAVADATGMSASAVSRMVTSARTMGDFWNGSEFGHRYPCPAFAGYGKEPSPKERPFAAPLSVIPAVAQSVMNTSVHKMFFGEEGKILLPGVYSVMAERLEQMSGTVKQELLGYARALTDDWRRNGKMTRSAYGQFRPTKEILYERIRELANENPYSNNPRYLFNTGSGGPNKLKMSLAKLASEQNRDAPEKTVKYPDGHTEQAAYEPGLDMIMFFALESGQAMEYFVRNDYINIAGGASEKSHDYPGCEILRKTADGGVCGVKDKDSLRILSYCVSLESGRKQYLIAEIARAAKKAHPQV